MIKSEEFVEIKSLYKKGLSQTEIAKRLNVDRKTVYNNLKKNKLPKYIRKIKVDT
jgi:transposase